MKDLLSKEDYLDGEYFRKNTVFINDGIKNVYQGFYPEDKVNKGMEEFIDIYNNLSLDNYIRLALSHYVFETVHPFYDGNGRTGRIINVLYLVINDLLDLPILYLSRYIITNKAEYYRLIQSVREEGKWEEWILFILRGIEETAGQTITLVKEISKLMLNYKVRVRDLLKKAYSHELLNNLFSHPYTKIEYVMEETGVISLTATKYLNKLVDAGLLYKVRHGKYNYYLNMPLIGLLSNSNTLSLKQTEQIESVNR
jgi:Fic family protein